jgi:hypothetical protein
MMKALYTVIGLFGFVFFSIGAFLFLDLASEARATPTPCPNKGIADAALPCATEILCESFNGDSEACKRELVS